MPPAIYQFLIEGVGAEKFAVDQRGYLYRDSVGVLDADRQQSSYYLHVRATEIDTIEQRSSAPITLHIHIVDANDNQPSFAQAEYFASVPAYHTNAEYGAERAVAKIQAKDLDAGKYGRINYRITDVSNGGASLFRYDDATNELRAIGALTPGQHYRVCFLLLSKQKLVTIAQIKFGLNLFKNIINYNWANNL